MPEGRRRHAVIAALGVTQIMAWGSSYYLPAVLAAPVAAETGWPLAAVVGALSAGLLVAGLISPAVGRAIGAVGGRAVLATSSVLLAAGLAILAAAPTLPVFVAGWLVLGAGMGCGLYDAAFGTLGGIFGAKARPAITVLTLWGGFASTVCWPLSAFLAERIGWRGTCLAYAAIQLGLSLPVILAFVPRPPRAGGDGAERPRPAAPLTPVERRALLLMAAIVTCGGTITAVVSVHLLTFLQAGGLTLAAAVAVGALVGPSQVAARTVEMAGGGRHPPVWTLAAALGLMALGLVLLWAGLGVVALAVIVYGAGNGVYSIARGTVPLGLFGPDRYPALVGRLARPSLLAQALAPSLGAFALERWGATTALGWLAGLATVALGLVALLWLGGPARPAAP